MNVRIRGRSTTWTLVEQQQFSQCFSLSAMAARGSSDQQVKAHAITCLGVDSAGEGEGTPYVDWIAAERIGVLVPGVGDACRLPLCVVLDKSGLYARHASRWEAQKRRHGRHRAGDNDYYVGS
jgi:hypothetical protein